MKIKHIMVMFMAVVTLIVTLTTSIFPQQFFECYVPYNPYDAETDYYGGAACVQMALDNCDYPGPQPLNSQDDIFSSFLNDEPNWWFSDPTGMKKALNDNTLNSCGNWVDVSGTDREQVLGKIFFWMKVQNYLTPVNIGKTFEYWVVITGYKTDIEPTSENSQVILKEIRFDDPNAGNQSSGVAFDDTWTTEYSYWGDHEYNLNDNGSYNNLTNNSYWNGKYIAILEPPEVNITVKVPTLITKGPIIPVEIVRKTCFSWLKKKIVEARKRCLSPYKMLKSPIIKKTVLINAKKPYYLIPLEDGYTVITWDSILNKPQQFRHFKNKRNYGLAPHKIFQKIKEILNKYKVKNVKMLNLDFHYKAELAEVGLGKLSPTSVASVSVEAANSKKNRKKNRKKYKLTFYFNYAGHLIKSKGLEKLPLVPGKVKKLKEKYK